MNTNINVSITLARLFVRPLRKDSLSYLILTPLGRRLWVTRLTTLTVRFESQLLVVLLRTIESPNTPKCPTSFGLAAHEAAFSEASGTTVPLAFCIKNRPTPLPRLWQGVLVRTHIWQTWPNTPKLPIHIEFAQVPTAENILVKGIFENPIPLWLILKQSRGTLVRKVEDKFDNLPCPDVQHTNALAVRIKPLKAVLLCVLNRTLNLFESFNFGTMGGAERHIPYLGHRDTLPPIRVTTPLTARELCLL